MGEKRLSLDLRNVTYSDAEGTQVLKDIYAQTNAELVAGSLWAEYLANTITNTKSDPIEKEPEDGFDA